MVAGIWNSQRSNATQRVLLCLLRQRNLCITLWPPERPHGHQGPDTTSRRARAALRRIGTALTLGAPSLRIASLDCSRLPLVWWLCVRWPGIRALYVRS